MTKATRSRLFLWCKDSKGILGSVYLDLTDCYPPGLFIPIAMRRIVSNVSSPFFVVVPRAPTPSINSLLVLGTCHVIDSGRRYAIKTNVRSASSSAPHCLQCSVVSGSSSEGAFLLSTGRTRRCARTAGTRTRDRRRSKTVQDCGSYRK